MTFPVQSGPGDAHHSVAEYLQLILDTVVNVFEQERVTLPQRRYWTVGGVAADCEQLTVHLTQTYKGLPGDDPTMVQRCGSRRSATVVVQLFRSSPAGNGQQPPSAAIMQRAAETPAIDAWLLLDAADAIDTVTMSTGVMAEVNVAEPSGGLVGVTMTLTTAIP